MNQFDHIAEYYFHWHQVYALCGGRFNRVKRDWCYELMREAMA